MTTSSDLPLLDETVLATTRYLAALTGLEERSLREPSLLPGWSRAHVVAHLARNADGFTRVLDRATSGQQGWMYETQEARERDIAETVQRLGADELVRDAEESSRRLEEAWRACRADPSTPYTRLPGDEQTFPLSTVGPRRLAEVEIHHADLGTGYLPTHWPLEFSTAMIAQRQAELMGAAAPSMVLSAADVEGRWTFGAGDGPLVEGRAGDLAWWLVGRGDGSRLTCERGSLPVLGRWR